MKLNKILATLLLTSAGARGAAIYHAVDLGVVGARDLNNSGQVVGSYQSSDGNRSHAFLWSNGIRTDLGTLGGGSGSTSSAYAINDSGQITGTYQIPGGAGGAFLYSNGTMSDLGTGGYGAGYDINRAGQIAGKTTQFAGGASAPFLWTNGTLQNLGFLGSGNQHLTNGSAFALNNTGEVVGITENGNIADQSDHAFRYSNGVMSDLGLGANKQAFDINDSGQITGTLDSTNSTAQGFIDTNGVIKTLPMPGVGINSSGQVVGGNANGTGTFLYSGGIVTSLNGTTDWDITVFGAIAINDVGQILVAGLPGLAGSTGGPEHTYLLTPLAAPEPSSLLLVAAFGAGMTLRRLWSMKRRLASSAWVVASTLAMLSCRPGASRSTAA